MIILPFHKKWKSEGDESMENVGHGWRGVNQRVMKNAPCSVSVFVDRGFGNGSQTPGPTTPVAQRVCILFFGGPDDREALELGGRMVEHPFVKVTVMRFVHKEEEENKIVTLQLSPTRCTEQNYTFSTSMMDREREKNDQKLDEAALAGIRSKWDITIDYIEIKETTDIVEEVLAIGRSHNYDLIMIGKGRFPSSLVTGVADLQPEHEELGPIGDILASSRNGVVSSVLVIQQHDATIANDTSLSKVLHSKYEKSVDNSSGHGEIS